MQKRGGSDQEVWQRNALAFSGKLMTQAGCTLPCLAQEWGLFERRQLPLRIAIRSEVLMPMRSSLSRSFRAS